LIGLGVDESTAAIIKGHEMEVVGKHQVAVYDQRDPNAKRDRDYEVLQAGGRYDLQKCQVVAPESKVIPAAYNQVVAGPIEPPSDADPDNASDSTTSFCR
jgi:hypothetical protein